MKITKHQMRSLLKEAVAEETAAIANDIVKKIVAAAPPSGSMVTKEVADRMVSFIQERVGEDPDHLNEMIRIQGGDYLVALGFLIDLGFEL